MKKIKIFGAALIFTLLISGCASQQKAISTKELSDSLLKNVTFQDELTLANKETVEKLYNIQDMVSSYVYISSGASAEEIAAFEFKNEKSAKQAITKVEARLSEQKDSFESYIPSELRKLENAVVKQAGCYLVVCVSDGEDAEKIIENHMK